MSGKWDDTVGDVLASVREMLHESEPVLELVHMIDEYGNVVELKRDKITVAQDSNLMRLIKDNSNLINGALSADSADSTETQESETELEADSEITDSDTPPESEPDQSSDDTHAACDERDATDTQEQTLVEKMNAANIESSLVSEDLCTLAESLIAPVNEDPEPAEREQKKPVFGGAFFQYDALHTSNMGVSTVEASNQKLIAELKEALTPYIENIVANCVNEMLTKMLPNHNQNKDEQ